MSVSLASLIESTRIDSGLRNNDLFTDPQIADLLSDAYADLRDKMIVRFAYWFRKSYEFTLTNGNGNNVLDLSLVPDLEMVQAVMLLDSNGNEYPIPLMSSISEVNQMNSTFPFNGNWNFSGFLGRKYFLDGDSLFIYPAANAGGSYRLIHTPQAERFVAPVTVDFDLDDGDGPFVPPPGTLVDQGTGAWLLLNSGLNTDIPTDETVDMNLTFTTTNLGFSGAYPISGIGLPPTFGSPFMACNNLVSTAGFTSPPTGTGSYTYQPIGTISSLPNALTPWKKYLTLHASIVIRTSRQQQIQELELQFKQISDRVVAVTKQRTEGVRQPPVTRTNYGSGGFGNGGGFGY